MCNLTGLRFQIALGKVNSVQGFFVIYSFGRNPLNSSYNSLSLMTFLPYSRFGMWRPILSMFYNYTTTIHVQQRFRNWYFVPWLLNRRGHPPNAYIVLPRDIRTKGNASHSCRTDTTHFCILVCAQIAEVVSRASKERSRAR